MLRRFALVLSITLAACSEPPVDSPPTPPSAAEGLIDVPADSGASSPRLVSGPDGPVLSWVEPSAEGHALRVSHWTGTGWGTPETADEGPRWFVNWADTPGVVPGADGAWLAHTLTRHPDGGGHAYDIRVRQRGGNAALLHSDGVAAEHGFVSATPVDDGVGLVWLDGRNQGGGSGHHAGNMTLRYATVAPDGSRRDEAELDARTCDCCPTALVSTASGMVAAYRDRSLDEIRDIAVVRRVDGVWTEPTVPHPDGWRLEGCPVNGPALGAQGDRVALAWFTAADSARVQLSISDDGGATWGAPVRLDGGAPIGRVGVDVLGDGDVVVSWLEQSGDDAEIRIRRLAGDTLGTARTVATVQAGRATGIPRIVGLGNQSLVAWTDAAAGTVRSRVVAL